VSQTRRLRLLEPFRGWMHTSLVGKVHLMPSKYDPETRAKAVRLVLEHRDDYPSERAAITAVSKRLGMNAETLRKWIRQQQVDDASVMASVARLPRRSAC
jgi:transposase-like protein